MKNKALIIPILCLLPLVSCKEAKKQTSQKKGYYETMSVTRGERTLTTGYSAAISGVQNKVRLPLPEAWAMSFIVVFSKPCFANN